MIAFQTVFCFQMYKKLFLISAHQNNKKTLKNFSFLQFFF
jgi:hypothetical protein